MSASASKGRRRSFNRRDFGLGQRKIAVPGAEGNGGVLLGSPTAGNVAEPSKKKKAKRRSVGERVMDMFHLKKRGEGEQKATLPVVPPSPQQALRNNLQSLPTSSGSSPRASPRLTPTPSPLRSRALRQQVFTERHDSLEAVMHEYGYKKDGTPMLGRKKMQPGNHFSINSSPCCMQSSHSLYIAVVCQLTFYCLFTEDKMVRLKIKSSGKGMYTDKYMKYTAALQTVLV